MTVRFYSSLDTGAPMLPSLGGQRLIDNLKIILKACLLDGYGSQPASGWTLGHEHADGFSLSNGEGFINFVNYSSTAVVVYLMESITSGNTSALATGDNRRSGPWYEGQTTSTRQYLYIPGFTTTSANKQWYVVADDKTVTMMVGGGGTTGVDGSSNYGAVHFGRYHAPVGNGFCALGGGAAPSSTGALFSGTVGTALRHPYTGVIDQGAAPLYLASAPREVSSSGQSAYPILTPPVIRPVRSCLLGIGSGLNVNASGSTPLNSGLLRGVIVEPALSGASLTKVLQALGIASPVYNDRIKPIALPVAVGPWVPIWPGTADLGGFVSLDHADWG